MGKRDPQEINASSMADIAFLLLVFFLVTTTMDTDFGLARKLPPPLEQDQEPPIKQKERNIFEVLANANDQLLVEGDLMDVKQLKEAAKEFIVNSQRKENLPEWEDISVSVAKQELAAAKGRKDKDAISKWEDRLKAAELLGTYTVTKQVISLQNDRGTSYDLYIQVQNELAAAYNELRNELCQSKFGMSYDDLEDKAKETNDEALKDKVDAIRLVFPQKISEAEPKDIG